MQYYKKNILEAIGNTPLVAINKLNPCRNVKILAKLEGCNPGGSVKDRTALYLIKRAIKDGTLTKDKIILEPTSGNTGIGIAMVAAVLEYRTLIVLPESVSIERRKILKAFGAEIMLSPSEKGTDGAIDLAKEIISKEPDKYIMLDQFSNNNNILAHYETTGKEIIEQTGGDIDYFVAGIGTSGTLMGAGARLKEYNNKIKIIAAEPVLNHSQQGLKNLKEAHVPPIFDRGKVDEVIEITDEESFNLTKELAKKEGIFVGISSGSVLAAALKIAKRIDKGTIVVVFPDSGFKYLSTEGLFE
jgi:cysteine synthase